MAERKSILLRLDPAVHDALAKWAADEMRSTNAQIEFLLRRALGDAGRMPGSARAMRRPGRPVGQPAMDDDKESESGLAAATRGRASAAGRSHPFGSKISYPERMRVPRFPLTARPRRRQRLDQYRTRAGPLS
jgi:hypothetical protein